MPWLRVVFVQAVQLVAEVGKEPQPVLAFVQVGYVQHAGEILADDQVGHDTAAARGDWHITVTAAQDRDLQARAGAVRVRPQTPPVALRVDHDERQARSEHPLSKYHGGVALPGPLDGEDGQGLGDHVCGQHQAGRDQQPVTRRCRCCHGARI